MAWSPAFRAYLGGRQGAYRYLLESIQISGLEPYPGDLRVSSCGLAGYMPLIAVDAGTAGSGGDMAPRSWATSTGSWSIPLTSAPPELRAALTRGMTVALRIGIPGMGVDAFERVLLGTIQNLRFNGRVWSLDCNDFIHRLNSKPAVASARDSALFAELDTSSASNRTTLSAAYAPADTSIQVGSTSVFRRKNDGGGTLKGAAKLIPSSGDPFYVTWTGTATGPTRLTGLPASNLFNTTRVACSSGDAVYPLAYDEAHPLTIFKRIAVSTGTALKNGADDIYPGEWGFGLDPGLLDLGDLEWYEGRAGPSSGTAAWVMLEIDREDSALGWWSGWAAKGGYFPAMVMGCLTARAIVSQADDALTVTSPGFVSISDADIAGVESYEAWDGSCQAEYHRVKVSSGDGTVLVAATETPDSSPAVTDYTIALADGVNGVNESAWRTEIGARLGPWALRVPEVVTLRLAGHRCAHLGRGDVVSLTTRLFTMRDGTFPAGQRCYVRSASVDWFGGDIRLALWILPRYADEVR